MLLFRHYLLGGFLLLIAGCEERRHEMPPEGKMSFGSLRGEEMGRFFEEKAGVALTESPVFSTSAFKYFNESGTSVGFTDVIIRLSPDAARGYLREAKAVFKKKEGLHFEYQNYREDSYAGMTIRVGAPVLYWDDGSPLGEKIYLEVDDESGVVRLSYSTGVVRDELAEKAAAK